MRRFVYRVMFTFAVLYCTETAALAVVIDPVYTATFDDAVTGDNAFDGSDGKRHWTIDPGADSYQNDFYERPTAQTYELVDGLFATDGEYFENLDIIQAKAGVDGQYFYAAIELFGLDKSTADGVDTLEGLVYQYGVRLSVHPDGRGGFLLVADQPQLKNSPNTTFGLLGTFGYQDQTDTQGLSGADGDVGGHRIGCDEGG